MLSAIAFTACVDNSYDLGNIDSDNIGLGSEESVITAPVGCIEINLADILLNFTRASQTYTLSDQVVESSYLLNEGWLSSDIKSALTGGNGEVSLSAAFTPYPEGLPSLTIDVWFGEIQLFDDAQVVSAQSPKVTSQMLSDEEIEAISEARTMGYRITFSESSFTCDFEEAEQIEVNLTITKNGYFSL